VGVINGVVLFVVVELPRLTGHHGRCCFSENSAAMAL
jgi:hypothetical protein